MSDDEEEDWFERAMREADEGAERSAEDEEESDDGSESGAPDEGETADADEEPVERSESDPFGGGELDQFGESGAGSDTGGEADSFGGGGEGGADPFGGVAGGERSESGADPFGDASGFGERGSGGGAIGEEGGAGEFGGGGSEGFGGGGFGGEPESFDEAELDSDIDRIDVGIEGLDEMVLGGVPKRSLMVAIGAAGTGKTTFGLQFLTEALQNDGRAIYVTLEESREAILSTAEEKGWSFREWREEGRLAIVAMDPIEMANSLSSIRNDISRLVEEFNADRLVLDSVSLLEMMYDHPAQRRSEVFDFARSLKRAGVTTMLTSEANSDDPYTSRYGIIEYLVDAVFILQYVRPSDFRETRLAVEIQKIRDANHSRETKPYEITNEGISVYRQANIF
ncbi:KaiC domain-containing protein [Halolamina sp. CBA1230]|uniref:KaiC domain-containing protein n=1 Tax=Halolamina sp. CBA1230 TaxID=1853690 RepID=UPI0009A1A195|nr:KaiC domain-containing protein [Halolamina sp. CBA1230]QKY19861.1 KaiC domain-containing protein [Halolamina sp. CBA1230]